MSHLSKKIITAAIFSALAAPLIAAASDLYQVSATLSHTGEVFASPTAVVHADKPASVEVSGENGYKFAFTVTDLGQDQIQVATSLRSEHGSMAPTVVVRPDKPATVSIGDLSLEVTVSRNGG